MLQNARQKMKNARSDSIIMIEHLTCNSTLSMHPQSGVSKNKKGNETRRLVKFRRSISLDKGRTPKGYRNCRIRIASSKFLIISITLHLVGADECGHLSVSRMVQFVVQWRRRGASHWSRLRNMYRQFHFIESWL